MRSWSVEADAIDLRQSFPKLFHLGSAVRTETDKRCFQLLATGTQSDSLRHQGRVEINCRCRPGDAFMV